MTGIDTQAHSDRAAIQHTNFLCDEERKACLAIDPAGFQIRHPPPPHELKSYITHDRQLFHTIHMGAAVVDVDRWRLVVGGLVKQPFHISLSELQRLPRSSITSFHECYGSPLVAPSQAKNLLRIGNVKWTGVCLRTLLDRAQPLPGARFVWSDGLDYGSFAGIEVDRYQKDLPIEKAVSSEVMLAYQMNDRPLSKERGGPVRLIVPGWFGTNSTKWICRLSVQAERAPGPFTTRWYNAADPEDPSGKMLPMWEAFPNSMIVKPKSGEQIGGPEVEISGFAWSCDGISTVGISTDQGESWINAEVAPRKDFGWQEFNAIIHLRDGQYRMMAKATSNQGLQQPLFGRRNCVHIIETVVRRG